MLHILISSPMTCDFQGLLRIIGHEDELLLVSDGVVSGVVDSIYVNKLMLLIVDIVIYALEDDVIARGLSDCFFKKICVIDYIGFVVLTEKHNLCMSW